MGTTHLDLVRANFGRRSEIQGELRQIDEAATTDKRQRNETENARVEELRGELKDIDGRITEHLEIEARSQTISDSLGAMLGAITDHEHGRIEDTRSLGEQFTAAKEVREWAAGPMRGTSPVLDTKLNFRAVTDLTTGTVSPKARLGRVANSFLDRRQFLIDLLPSINVSSGSVEVVSDGSPLADLADKATAVTEGTAKPQAGLTLSIVNEPVATIAAWANLTRQAAADLPQIESYLDGRLRYSVKRNADKQVVGGSGVAPNLNGLTNRAGVVYAPGAAEARYISIRRAIRLMEDVEAVPEFIVLNPADAEVFDLSNAATAGLHSVMSLADGPAPTAWGLRQVHSTAVAAGTALLIDPTAVAILDRQQVTAYMTDSHASNFTSNILTLLLECRLGLAVFAANGIAKVTFNGAN